MRKFSIQIDDNLIDEIQGVRDVNSIIEASGNAHSIAPGSDTHQDLGSMRVCPESRTSRIAVAGAPIASGLVLGYPQPGFQQRPVFRH